MNFAKIVQILNLLQQLAPYITELLPKKTPPAAPPATPQAPVATPAGPVTSTPIVVSPTRPAKTVAKVAGIVSGVEKPERVGGGPGINYEDWREKLATGSNFNYGCVAFIYGKAFDADGDEFMGPDIIAANLEFRTAYRVYRDGQLVAWMIGAGDDNPIAEGHPAPWSQSPSGDVNFGFSRWEHSAGFDNRLTFVGQGRFEIEVEIGGVKAPRIAFNVS